jgi:phosphomethylpyrimidine synthase
MNKEEKSQEHRFQIRQRFISGEIHPIKVAMREISQDDTKMSNGRIEKSAHYYLRHVRSLHRSKY